jgi:phosphomannomutase
VLNALPTSFNTPELNVPCAEGEHHGWWPNCWRAWPTGRSLPRGRVSTIDGLRVDYADGFGLIRGSNTTPVLVLRFEGHTPRGAAPHRRPR